MNLCEFFVGVASLSKPRFSRFLTVLHTKKSGLHTG